MRVDIPVRLETDKDICCLEPVCYAAVEEDGTSGLVIEVFDDLDKVCADVVLLHQLVCPLTVVLSLDFLQTHYTVLPTSFL